MPTEPEWMCNTCNQRVCFCQATCQCGRQDDCICDSCRQCILHCECRICAGCNNVGTIDPNCDQCTNCCVCTACTSCERRYSGGCEECRTCNNCCEHREQSYSSVAVNNHATTKFLEDSDPKLTSHPKASYFKFNSKRFVAAEMEISKSKIKGAKGINKALSAWSAQAVTDGSLPGTGYEINTAPAKGNLFVSQILSICDSLKDAGAKVDNSCGLHVHVDGKDLKFTDMHSITRVYHKVEPVLFQIVAPSRERNRYCKSCGEYYYKMSLMSPKTPDGWRKNFFSMFYGDSFRAEESRKNKRHESRYNALNLHSWMFRGSVEFRHHQGSVNAAKIIHWAAICASIVDFGANHSVEEVEVLFRDLEPVDALKMTLGDDTKTIHWLEDRIKHFASQAEDEIDYFEAAI